MTCITMIQLTKYMTQLVASQIPSTIWSSKLLRQNYTLFTAWIYISKVYQPLQSNWSNSIRDVKKKKT